MTQPVQPLEPLMPGITNGELLQRDADWEALLAKCNARLADVNQLVSPFSKGGRKGDLGSSQINHAIEEQR